MVPDAATASGGWRRRLGSGLVLLFALTAHSLQAAVMVVAEDLDGDGWQAFDANLGVPWTTWVFQQDSDVWGSGGPTSGRGVAFSGPATLGQPGLFDDHIVESSDLAVNLGLVNADRIYFHFYQDSLDYSPNEFSVFIRDFEANDWYINVPTPAAAGWTAYSVYLTATAGWYSPTGGTDFLLALTGGTAQQMGIRLQYQAGVSQEQRYGLADYYVVGPFIYTGIPEPSSAIFLVFGSAVIWTWRRGRAPTPRLI